jgi:hypothetical protein
MLRAGLALDWGLRAGVLTAAPTGRRSVKHMPSQQAERGDEGEARQPT